MIKKSRCDFQWFLHIRSSAYKIAMDLNKNDQAGSTSNGGDTHSFFRKLWKINAPHTVRHNAWRASRDILSTKANLVHCHVLLDDTCEKCVLKSESLIHFFWECPKAQETWQLSNLFQSLHLLHSQNLVDSLWYLLMEA